METTTTPYTPIIVKVNSEAKDVLQSVGLSSAEEGLPDMLSKKLSSLCRGIQEETIPTKTVLAKEISEKFSQEELLIVATMYIASVYKRSRAEAVEELLTKVMAGRKA